MTLYVVQVPGIHTAALEKARFIRDGFSKPAFLFAAFWLLYHRLWTAAAAWIVAETVVVWLCEPHLPGLALFALDVLARLYLGFEGNRLRLTRHAAITDLVEARDLDEAEAIFFKRQADARRIDRAGPRG